MSVTAALHGIQRLKERIVDMTRAHYATARDNGEVEQQAVAAGDTDYLLARLRLCEAERDAAQLHLVWLDPSRPGSPKESLARIQALCSRWEDLYEALQSVSATHPQVSRELLARAVKQCRKDVEAYSVEDLVGLMVAAWNGGRHGFDAVLRTRKQGARRATSSVPWGRID